MGIQTGYCFTRVFLVAIILWSSLGDVLAVRPLDGEQWLEKNFLVQSLQRGPVPSSGSNPCTYIPGRNRGRCTLSQMNIAGSVAQAPPAFPDLVVDFAAASVVNETQKQDASS